MTPLDPDRTLALAYVPMARRVAVAALWHLDATLGAVVASGREPMLKQIKLVWWRDALQQLDTGRAPAEPVLQALSQAVIPLGIKGEELSALCDGWHILLSDAALTEEELASYAEGRGHRLFDLTTRLLGGTLSETQRCQGGAWALIDLARHSGEPDSGSAARAAHRYLSCEHWPAPVRILGMLATLAAQDAKTASGSFEAQGSPARMWRMLRHRFTGR